MSDKPYPLEGLRVLDLSRVLAGPYVGRLLCDLGAEVVKVEPPEGDVTRNWGKVVAGLSGYYTQQNVGKEAICIDLRQPGGPALLKQLAARADVLVENFRPGVMAQYGLAYAQLAQDNPRLVMLSISGFGQTGPQAPRPAYASVLHAESGIVERQAHVDGTPPVDPRVSIADMNAALHGTIGVLSALHLRERTGRGQHVDIGMLDAMLATDDYVHLALDGVPPPHGIVNDIWEVASGHVVVAGDFRWVWRQLNAVCGLADPTPPGASLHTKIEARRKAVADYLRAFPDRPSLYAALDKANLAWGDVLTSAQALSAPTLAARQSLTAIDDRAGGSRRVMRTPYRFSQAESGVRGVAPHQGEHNHHVLRRWLALGEAEIDALEAAGVLLRETPG
ncbi:MAG TPA: CaiB/BaiF CoA-transferase family protein [Polyangiales bacterium]